MGSRSPVCYLVRPWGTADVRPLRAKGCVTGLPPKGLLLLPFPWSGLVGLAFPWRVRLWSVRPWRFSLRGAGGPLRFVLPPCFGRFWRFCFVS